MSKSIFLSYAHQDHDLVSHALRQLSNRGLLSQHEESVVDPIKNIEPGSSIRDTIRRAIQSASKVVLVWTEAGAISQWVHYEAGMAQALEKPIIVIVPYRSAPKLPDFLKGMQVVRLSEDTNLRVNPDAPYALRRLRALTPRQKEILRLVAQGLTSREIADRLEISVRTVEVHRLNLMRRPGVRKTVLGQLQE